ncbi:protein FAM151B-like isoform X2 [Homarus americanus]|uniref:Protein FAM151B-like n=2 Tax=Homarus americanus TaxID=6706 RepID=A0A8J5MS24_HOMAM|nr:protein FAM151B-like isoform X2 [Homarus americanus]KAG7161241.1 protein FAM151B-like [Homarus americanus]
MATKSVKGNIVDVADYFPEASDDLSKVIWGHAVNSKEELEKSIADAAMMMLEADVSAGRLVEQGEDDPVIPIMAHPPSTESDLSLEMWIDKVIEANQDGKKKGAKLDFKDLTIVKESLELLKSRTEQINFPLWLNADILKGPVESTAVPLDAGKFLTWCSESFPQATLSIGWTTRFTSADDEAGAYTKEMVEEMSDTLEANSIAQPITFPIRAAFVGQSLESLEWLVDNIPDCSVSVWSSPSDDIDVQALIALRENVGSDTVYFDLPEDQQKAFDEVKDRESSTSAARFQFLPQNTSAWATAGVALASALAALYLYE